MTATDDTLILLNEAISLGRRDGMAGQHLDAMCSARDDIARLSMALSHVVMLIEGGTPLEAMAAAMNALAGD